MNTCALSGQAAGTLAARCIELGKRPGDLEVEEIQGVQQTLLRNDMMIPGIRHREERDLAREAGVSSSGAECRGAFLETGTFSLSDGGILVFPRRAAGTEFLVESGQTTEVSYQCYRSDVPSRLALGSRVGTMKTVIPEGKSWVRFPIPEGVADGFITLEFSENQSVLFATGEEQLTGFLLGREDSPRYCYPCLKLPDGCGLYGEANVVNGYNRPWREPGSWISGPAFGEGGEFPWIRLDFQEDVYKRQVQVIAKDGKEIENMTEAYTEASGVMINSGDWNGMESAVLKQEAPHMIEEKGFGHKTVNYKLRDWVFSRQRYWGEPIPIIHCPDCGAVPVPEEELPLRLPDVESYEPTGTGESPLAGIEDWVNCTCPVCGKPAKRETNTMPQWAGSSWYFLRYVDNHNSEALVSREKADEMLPVDMYIGGVELSLIHI